MSRLLQNEINLITYKFGGSHHGIDLIPADYSLCNILAHSDGTVVGCRNDYTKCDEKTGASYGNYVELDHGNGYHTVYAHMKAGTVTVKVGQKVKKGQVLGWMWNSGKSNGKHLHFEVKKDGIKIDPTLFLENDFPKEDINSKSTMQLAVEVLDKKHGNGDDRKKSLGDRFDEVQDKVNFILDSKKKTDEQIAKEILDGLWDNNPYRQKAIEAIERDYAAIQKVVNQLVDESKKVYHTVAAADTLESIAAKYDTSIEALVELNILISKGQKLRVK